MPNDASLEANERMRWATMDSHKLRIRLNKIKKPEKLAWFMRVAMEQHEDDLFELATARATELGITGLYAIRQIVDEYYLRRQREVAYRLHALETEHVVSRETEEMDLQRALTRENEVDLGTVDISGAEAAPEKPTIRKIRF